MVCSMSENGCGTINLDGRMKSVRVCERGDSVRLGLVRAFSQVRGLP